MDPPYLLGRLGDGNGNWTDKEYHLAVSYRMRRTRRTIRPAFVPALSASPTNPNLSARHCGYDMRLGCTDGSGMIRNGQKGIDYLEVLPALVSVAPFFTLSPSAP
eukprot:6030723-Pyramimonas_sp.AAC.1